MDLKVKFAEKLNSLIDFNGISKVAVAVSGGVDSMALSFLLHNFCNENDINLNLITINHNIRKESIDEARYLNNFFKNLNINHVFFNIKDSEIPSQNIEAKLRELRYNLFYDYCCKNNIKYLFLGHHLGDIAENFLIRLFRGSGLDGLSPISDLSKYKEIYLVRPLLDFSKKQLFEYIDSNKIPYFLDKTNFDQKFLRNKIRSFLESFPEYENIQARIKKTSEDIFEMKLFYDDLLIKEMKNVISFDQENYYLNKIKFSKINKNIALKILALILMEVGEKNYKPRFNKLKNFYDLIIQNQKFKKRNFYGCIIEESTKDILVFCKEPNDKVKRCDNFNQLKIKDLLS